MIVLFHHMCYLTGISRHNGPRVVFSSYDPTTLAATGWHVREQAEAPGKRSRLIAESGGLQHHTAD
jgi:hypothetical protein